MLILICFQLLIIKVVEKGMTFIIILLRDKEESYEIVCLVGKECFLVNIKF